MGMYIDVHDKGLVTNYGEGGGGYKTGGGGGMWSFTPTKRGGGADKVLAKLKGGHNKFWGSFYAVAWDFSHIVGGRKKFPLFKRGGARKVLTCLEVGAQTVLDPVFSHFVAPPRN